MAKTETFTFFRTLASHTLVFGLSTIVRPLSQLILVRLHTNLNFVQVENFASWTLFQAALNIAIAVFNMGLATTFFRFYLLADSEEEKRKIISNCFRLTMTIAFAGGLLSYATSSIWTQWLTGRCDLAMNGQHIVLAVVGNTLTIIPMAYFRAEGLWKPFLAFSLLKLFLLLSLNGVLLIQFNMDINGITSAVALTNIILMFIFVPFIFKQLRWNRWSAGWKRMLKYGIPLISIDITYWTMSLIGPLSLNHWQGPEEVALFGFAFRISSIALLAVILPFSIAFGPLLFKAQKESVDPKPLFARTMGYIWTIAVGFCLAITLFAGELSFVLGKSKSYHEAVLYVGFLVFSTAFYGLFFVFTSGANLKDKTWVLPVVLSLALAVEVLLNWILTPRFGTLGASISMLLAFVALAGFTYGVNQKLFPIEFPWRRVMHSSAIAIVILAALVWMPGGKEPSVRLLFLLFYPILLIFTGFLDDGEWQFLSRIKEQWFRNV